MSLDRLRLQATNLEVGITCYLHAHIDADGAITVPARTIVDLVNAMPDDEQVTLEVNEHTQTLTISAGAITATSGRGREEFPRCRPATLEAPTCRWTPSICTISSTAWPLQPPDENRRSWLACTALDGETFTLAAADGSVYTDSSLDHRSQAAASVIVRRALMELSRIMGEQDKPIGIALGEVTSQIYSTDRRPGVPTIDGNTGYVAILPKDSTTIVTVDGTQLSTACKAAMSLRASQTSCLYRARGELIVRAASAETGDNSSVIDADVQGPDMTIAFDVRYIKDFLAVLEKRKIQIHLTDAAHAGLFTDETLPNFRGVVMPMTIDGRIVTDEPPHPCPE
jgi:DNA polymerase-3 subunit beta